MPTRRQFLAASLATPFLAESVLSQDNPTFSIKRSDASLVIQSPAQKPIVTYHQKKPADAARLPVDSACFFHPLHTPAGHRVTDLAPADHPHHRGVFLAFVETHTKTPDGKAIDADFWGWGEPAPVKGRKIVNAELADVKADAQGASFRATNHWRADDRLVLSENLAASVRAAAGNAPAWILDLAYTLTPAAEMTLSRWAFSGFCARTISKPANPKLSATGPAGRISVQQHPNPSHVKPETDWPDAPWYAYELITDAGGHDGGVAVINHADNPKTLWHNHRDVRMLNPCIVAPNEVKLTPDKPLVLRYQVVAFDGPTPTDFLNSLSRRRPPAAR